MELWVEHATNGIKKINLRGRMDIPGTDEINLQLVAETSTEKAFVVMDLSEVEFLASVGIGALVRSAKALRLRGGDLVLLSTVPIVSLVLEKTKIHEIIPIFGSLSSAYEALLPKMRNQD